MQLKVNEVKGVYKKLQMRVNEGKRHVMAFFWYKEKMIFVTKLSHGSGDAKAPDKIRGDFRLSEELFRDFG